MIGGSEPFFVVGAGRSGTTMFTLMLNAHPHLFIPTESWFLSDLMDLLPAGGSLTRAQIDDGLALVVRHWRWKEWGVDAEGLERSVRTLVEPTLAEFIDCVFTQPMGGGSDKRWGDKTPGYATEIGRLHRVFPSAQFIHLVRDGRDVCMSHKKTAWHGEIIGDIARYWSRTVDGACAAGHQLPHGLYTQIPYESLVLHTEDTLRSVCTFLGVEFEPRMLEFYKLAEEHIPKRAHGHHTKSFRPPNPSDVTRWQNEMTPFQRAIFEAFAGPTLTHTGYEREFHRGLWLIRSLYSAASWASEVSLPLRRKVGLHFPWLRRTL